MGVHYIHCTQGICTWDCMGVCKVGECGDVMLTLVCVCNINTHVHTQTHSHVRDNYSHVFPVIQTDIHVHVRFV